MKKYLRGFGVLTGLTLTLAALVLSAVPVRHADAASFKGGDSYALRKGDKVDGNLYAAGGNVSIEGEVNGDLVTGAGTVLMSGMVQDDILAGGGTIQVLGTVGGDIRIGGGTVTIGNEVGGEVVITGGTVTFLSGAHIEKDVTILGGTVVLDGEVHGNVKVRAGSVTLNGVIDKDADISAGQDLKMGATALIGGSLTYKAPTEAQMISGAEVRGETHFTKMTGGDRNAQHAGRSALRGILGAWFVISFLMMLVASLFLVWLVRPAIQHVWDHAKINFGKEMLRGLVVMIVTPIIAIILCVTVIGLIPGIVLGLMYVLLMIIAKATAGILFGACLERMFDKKTVRPISWVTAVSGVLALTVLSFIPIGGWILHCVFILAAFGSWFHFLTMKYHAHRAA
jgi:hypothetical protein